MDKKQSEIIALKTLAAVIADDDLRDVFLGSTGLSVEDLKNRPSDSDVLVGVLEFVLMDDAWVVSIAEEIEIPPEHLAEAKAGLPGGSDVYWT